MKEKEKEILKDLFDLTVRIEKSLGSDDKSACKMARIVTAKMRRTVVASIQLQFNQRSSLKNSKSVVAPASLSDMIHKSYRFFY